MFFPGRQSSDDKCAATAQAFMQQKIKRAQIWQLKSLDVAFANSREVLLHALRRHFTNQDRINFVAQSNQTNIRCVALVTRACMSKFYELNLHL